MTEHCDFLEQETLADGSRPDLVVRLPGRRMIAVDAKAPLNAYLASLEEETDAKRNEALDRHVGDMRMHIKTLAGRNYAEILDAKVDLVVMFLPGDPYLGAAFARDPDLQSQAIRQKILIATPTTLVALLRTVAIYWQQRSVAENAEKIAATARTLYERASIFADHLDKMGRGLRGAVDAYNQAVASFERRLLPMSKQLDEMKVTENTTRQIVLLDPLVVMPRVVSPCCGRPGVQW
jgi:DNA recombination protein RmuC